MKQIIVSLFIAFTLINTGICQTKDQRTITTKIADLLAQLPAQNSEQLKAAMEQVSAMGEDGIAKMAGMLSENPDANSKIEYAVNSFSYYVMQPGKENLRGMAVKAYCDAIPNVSRKENKAFLLSQIQIAGKNDAVACLQKYLNDEALCDPAARALVKINTDQSNTVLMEALQNAQGSCRLSLVEALGDTHYSKALALITPLVNTSDKKLTKVALYALANIADPSSEGILSAAASKNNFTFDETEATYAYLQYAENLNHKGQKEQAYKIAESLLKNPALNDDVHTRTVALKILADVRGPESVALLADAATDKDAEYRAAALKFAGNYYTPSSADIWLGKIKKAEEPVQASIITMLGSHDAKAALPVITKKLKSKNDEVKIAAITAAGKIGQQQSLDDLLKVMRKGNKEEIAAVKSSILTMKGDDITAEVADALPRMKSEAQVALLEVLSARAAHAQINTVFSLLKSKDQQVRMAALSALKSMAGEDNLRQLFALLTEVKQQDEISRVQQAIVAAASGTKNSSAVLQQMNNSPADKKPLYFNILAGIGDKESLKAVSAAFAAGDDATKMEAVKALANWKDASAATELYKISQKSSGNSFLDPALKGYIRMISISEEPAEQKVLMLKNAMELANTTEQKKLILNQLQGTRTFPALVFAGKYLDTPDLQQEAANAVMNIALSNPSFNGSLVKELLNKTIQVLTGNDSGYQKEAIRKFIAEMPQGEGFVSIFNGKDLSGWKGLVGNPIERAKMSKDTLAKKQKAADEAMNRDWKVEDGKIVFVGHGFDNLTTVKKYGDIEMLIDWKIYDEGKKDGDAGIYLRGTPQVQMWDTSRVDAGAQVGSGGLYNNKINPSKPLKVADNQLGEWNHFRILMNGDRVTVYLNGELVTDNVILENYWDAKLPIFPEEQLELQAHGSKVAYRDIYVREIPRPEPFELSKEEKKEGFKVLFDGTNMHEWKGNTAGYGIEDGNMVVYPKTGHGNLYTKDEYADFIFRFEFQLTPGANNGLGIRAPLEGDAAYEGMELQILDNDAPVYKDLKPYQYHGSVYGVLAAKRGFLKPLGEWNKEEVIVKGSKIKVILNGTTILDGDISDARKNGTLDGQPHPGLKRDKGYIGFLGHDSEVRFRNIRIKDLSAKK
ncbi:DUF1080 domain-containing protein [Rubrolithibacter danxiaensis]|uniref:DUF1080 domain-containing protein n=1 Tax=Rubrolithibacter danxiaensis TaxID=3390805 RepID=UPI003BF870C1